MEYDIFTVPFVPDLMNLNFDEAVIFILGMLTAILINCEAQGYVATFLGDIEPDKNKRHHFNVILHLDPLGLISYILGGFGWGKVVNVDSAKLKKPLLHTFFIRLSGPFGNFLLANIACSIIWLLNRYDIHDKTYSIVAAVNVMVAVYSLIPIPPLPGGLFLNEVLKKFNMDNLQKIYSQAGPFIIIAVILIEKLGSVKIFSILNPIVINLFKFIYIE